MITPHELATIFPAIEGEAFDALVADIKANGLLEKMVHFEGQILDGRNRFNACIKAGLFEDGVTLDDPRWFVEFNANNFGADTVERGPLAYVLAKNLIRRHLDESQRGMVGARIAKLKPGRPSETPSIEGVSVPDAAKRMNVGRATVERAKVVLEKGSPALVALVERGKLPVSQAAQAAVLSIEQQNEIISRAEAGQANVVRTTIKQGRRAAREAASAKRMLALPDKKYGVILADPEWEFVVWSNITGLDRSAANHYETSPWEKIAARDVQKISDKDCVCFLWVTDLARGLRVLEAWGFEFKSYFVWVKDIVEGPRDSDGRRTFVQVGAAGTGHWNMDRDEIMLIGTRGKVVAPAPGTQGESVWFAPRPKVDGTERGRHSAKPDICREWIEGQYPNVPKIELNARTARLGWESWGYEAPPETMVEGEEGAGEEADDAAEVETEEGGGEKLPAGDQDPLYEQAKALVVLAGKGSASYLQRKLEIGYDRSLSLLEAMEANGVVGPRDARGGRAVLISASAASQVSPPADPPAPRPEPPPAPAKADDGLPEIPEFLRRNKDQK